MRDYREPRKCWCRVAWVGRSCDTSEAVTRGGTCSLSVLATYTHQFQVVMHFSKQHWTSWGSCWAGGWEEWDMGPSADTQNDCEKSPLECAFLLNGEARFKCHRHLLQKVTKTCVENMTLYRIHTHKPYSVLSFHRAALGSCRTWGRPLLVRLPFATHYQVVSAAHD